MGPDAGRDGAGGSPEHLRSGVPLPPADTPLTYGRAAFFTRAADLLDTVAARGSRALALQANYGDGKTHALRAIWHLAAQRNFVVSSVALTRETPLDRLDRVYPKLIADTYLPGAGQPGIERLLDVPSGGEEAARLLRFAEDHLHPKLYAVLQNLLQGTSTEAADALLRDLARIDMGVAELKRIHRGNFGRALKLSRFSAQRDARDYFRLVDFLVGLRGYAGWVLLFDEAELIGRLGRGGRARALGNVGRLAGDGLGGGHVLSVFAVASNFYSDVLMRRHDAEEAPRWLEARGDTEDAEACRLGIAALQEAVLLEPLTPANWRQVMQAVLDAHETAYGWSAGRTAADLWQEVQRLAPETDTKLRTRLRLAIQWLDLLLQHGRPPQVRLFGLQEVGLEEQAETEAAAGREGEPAGGSSRHPDGGGQAPGDREDADQPGDGRDP